eukprot:4147465-Amphidinium_carterae.1
MEYDDNAEQHPEQADLSALHVDMEEAPAVEQSFAQLDQEDSRMGQNVSQIIEVASDGEDDGHREDLFDEAEVDIIAVASDDSVPASPRVDNLGVARRKRRRWDLNRLPEHIVRVETEFSQRFECHRCGCHAQFQSKSGFFATHWSCRGMTAGSRTQRNFKRKALLLGNRQLVPNAEQVLSLDWYQDYGVLPRCVIQASAKGLLRCSICEAQGNPCNRKKFMARHLMCLQDALTWHENGDFTYNEDYKKAATTRRKRAPSTFGIAEGTRKRGRQPAPEAPLHF